MVKDISDLKHTTRRLKNGGLVLVLDTGSTLDPESVAMIQAKHSRDIGGVAKFLEEVAEHGPAKFMQRNYVGYGHKSIGDCATTTLFIEGVSMLAAKAIQDYPLYAGQETSTRYVPFSGQPFIDPTNSDEGNAILETQRQFYLDAREPTIDRLRKLHPNTDESKPKRYEKAIKARAYDIIRSLLPAGASTNLAWHSNIRQAADKLLFLRHHPLEEVREIANAGEDALKEHHPNSFGHKRYELTEAYQDLIAKHYFYHDPNSPEEPVVDFSNINMEELRQSWELFEKRPPKTELPKFLNHIGTADIRYQLDFGSYRDIQRQRSVIQRMPLITTELGFGPWYEENLPDEFRERLPEHLERINHRIENLGISPEESQYFRPMGYKVSNRFVGDLPALAYIIELRDSRFVHPTLQRVAHSIGEQLVKYTGIPLHVDSEPNEFDVRRGDHDIVQRK